MSGERSVHERADVVPTVLGRIAVAVPERARQLRADLCKDIKRFCRQMKDPA